jgi:hypothetical protein
VAKGDVNIPRLSPFLVKKAVPFRKLTPQPMVSPGPNFGPYDLPTFWAAKQLPSSP